VDYLISYAQNLEDIYLSAFFPDIDRGFYVDVGANHPIVHSTTKRFSLGGWRGINLEPIRRHYEALRLDRPDDINLQVGISDKPGVLTFREYAGDGLSTFSRSMMQYYEANESSFTAAHSEYPVEVRTLRDVLDEFSLPRIDFMKIDIEGYEYEALEGNDWSRFRPAVLCIEANHVVRDWHPLVSEAGYQLGFFDGLNEYFVADEAQDRTEKFRVHFPQWFVNQQIVRHPVHLEFVRRDRDIQRLTAELATAQARTRSLEAELRTIEAPQALGEDRGLRDLVRDLDTLTERKLESWAENSRRARRQRLITLALPDPVGNSVNPGDLHSRLYALDAHTLGGEVKPTPLALGATRGYVHLRSSATRLLKKARAGFRARGIRGGAK
jgi:FkbM family methyltransferase